MVVSEFTKASLTEVAELSETERGEGGLGSTGK
jgi:dUTPase